MTTENTPQSSSDIEQENTVGGMDNLIQQLMQSVESATVNKQADASNAQDDEGISAFVGSIRALVDKHSSKPTISEADSATGEHALQDYPDVMGAVRKAVVSESLQRLKAKDSEQDVAVQWADSLETRWQDGLKKFGFDSAEITPSDDDAAPFDASEMGDELKQIVDKLVDGLWGRIVKTGSDSSPTSLSSGGGLVP